MQSEDEELQTQGPCQQRTSSFSRYRTRLNDYIDGTSTLRNLRRSLEEPFQYVRQKRVSQKTK